MFKVISGRTYDAIMKETKEIKADILVLQQNREADNLKIAEQQKELRVRGNKIQLLLSQNDACKSMRDDLKKKLGNMEAEMIKVNTRSEELLDEKSDEVKQLKHSIESHNNQLNKYKAQDSQLLTSINGLLEGINAAMAEMRKVNRGKPSHNKSRAFQHLEKAMAAYNAAQPKSSLPENAAPDKA